MAVTSRPATVLWVAGVAALAVATAFGSRVAQEHLGARRAWLASSAEVAQPSYDAARSDRLYQASTGALQQLETWAVVGGAGLLALTLGLGLRRGLPGPARRPWLRGAGALAAGLTVHALVSALAGAVEHELLGPALALSASTLAPFLALATAAAVWLIRR